MGVLQDKFKDTEQPSQIKKPSTLHPTASYKCHASKNTSFVKIAEMGLEAMLQFISVDAYSCLRKE
jgi:hypothetical protein